MDAVGCTEGVELLGRVTHVSAICFLPLTYLMQNAPSLPNMFSVPPYLPLPYPIFPVFFPPYMWFPLISYPCWLCTAFFPPIRLSSLPGPCQLFYRFSIPIYFSFWAEYHAQQQILGVFSCCQTSLTFLRGWAVRRHTPGAHKIIERFGLGGIFRGHLVQPPCN